MSGLSEGNWQEYSRREVQRERARRAFIQRDYVTTYQIYENLLKEYPGDPAVLLDYGRAKFNEFAGLEEQAAQLFSRALEADPNSLDVLFWLAEVGACGYGPGYRGAANLYRRMLKFDPQCVDAYIGLGMLYKSPGSPVTLDEAIDAYRKAIEIAPERADAHQNLGYVLADVGQGGVAQEELSIAARILKAEGRDPAGIQQNIERLRRNEPIINRAYVNNSPRFIWPFE